MFVISSRLYRLSELENELVMARYDDRHQQWAAIHIPSALRTQASKNLSLAQGSTSLFILSRSERKVYHVCHDLSLSKKIAFVNVDAMSNQINAIVQAHGAYCIIGFTSDMKGYIVDASKGGHFLSVDMSQFPSYAGSSKHLLTTFPGSVKAVRLISISNTIYAIVHFDQTLCALLHVDDRKSMCTCLAVHAFDQPVKLLYAFSVRSYVIVVCRINPMGYSTSTSCSQSGQDIRNSPKSFALSISSSRSGGMLIGIVFNVVGRSANNANNQKPDEPPLPTVTKSVFADLPDSLSQECIYHNGHLIGFDGAPIKYEPFNNLLSIAQVPSANHSRAKPQKEPAAYNDSFLLNISEISHMSDNVISANHSGFDGQILTQSLGFGNRRGGATISGAVIPLTDDLQDAYSYLGLPLDNDYVTMETLGRGLAGAIAKLRSMEECMTQENVMMKQQVDKLASSLVHVKENSTAQLAVCNNLNSITDDLQTNHMNIHNTITKLEANIADLARQQLIIASKGNSQPTPRQVPFSIMSSELKPYEKAEKDLTTSDMLINSSIKQTADTVKMTASTQTNPTKVKKTRSSSKSKIDSADKKPLSYRDVELAVQRTLRSLSPTRRIIQAPPEPILASSTSLSAYTTRLARSRLDAESSLRRQSTMRSSSVPMEPRNTDAISPSSMAERLRAINEKMCSSVGRARRIENALEIFEKDHMLHGGSAAVIIEENA